MFKHKIEVKLTNKIYGDLYNILKNKKFKIIYIFKIKLKYLSFSFYKFKNSIYMN